VVQEFFNVALSVLEAMSTADAEHYLVGNIVLLSVIAHKPICEALRDRSRFRCLVPIR